MNNLASTLGYRPLSYERYLAPLQAYNQALQSQEDLLSELTTKADVWNGLANQQTDKKAYAQYKKYADDLTAQANTLADKGLYEGSRRALLDLKNRYSKEIIPIENAYNTRKQQAELQQKARAAHPDMMYGRDASTTSLDTYLANPQYDALAQQYSGEQLKKNVEDAASALAREAHANPNIRASLQQLLPYQYYAELERTGFKSEDVYKAIHSDKGSPILKQIVNDAIQASGIQGWDNYNAIKDQAYGYANQGLWKAVGTTKFGPLEDKYGMEVALENLKHQHAMQQQAAAQPEMPYETSLPVDATDVSFGATNPEQAEYNYNTVKKLLGIGGKGANGKIGFGKVNVDGAQTTIIRYGKDAGKPITTYSPALNKNGTSKFDLYTKQGKVLTKQQFVAQGKDERSRKALGEYYDRARKYMGGSNWVHGIYSKLRTQLNNNGATVITMPNLDFEDNDKAFKGKVSNIVDNMQGAYEVTGGLTNWNKGKRYSGKEISDIEGALNYNVSFDSSNPGIVISKGGQKFFIPAQNLPTAGRQGFTNYMKKEAQYAILEKQLAKQKQEAAREYGPEYANEMYASYEKQIENARVNAKAEAMENIGWSIDGSYSRPTAKLFTQKDK